MMKRNVIFLGLLLFLSTPAFAQRQWTLDECMDYAIAHNTEMKMLQNEQKRREIKAQASKDARLPQFSGDMGGTVAMLRSTNGNRFDANEMLLNIGLTGYLPLYTGNRLSSQIKADQYALKAVAEDVRSAEKSVKAQVAAAFLQLLYYKGEASIARQQQEVSQLLEKRARSLFDKGKRPESDVVETEAMVSRDMALLAAAEGDIALAKLELKLLLNLPDTVDFDISEPNDSLEQIPLLQSHDVYTATSVSHPKTLSANYSIQQAEQEVKTARSYYRPTLSLVGGFGTFWNNMDIKADLEGQMHLQSPQGLARKVNYQLALESDWKRRNFIQGAIGLKLSIPIFNAFETRARIRTAKVNLENAKLAYYDTQQKIRKDIRQAWQGALTAHKRYEAEVKAEESWALAYRYALKRYDAGMATIFDLSQSRQQWFTASENALRMKYEYLMKKRILHILAYE